MLIERSFSQILNDLQTTQWDPSSENPSGYESHIDPFGLAQLITEVHITPIYKVSLQKIYPQKCRPKPCSPRPSHALNSLEQLALAVLIAYCPHLKDNFNLHELKSAYRLAVLKTHPDQGGNSETFQEVKKSYQILSALVKN